jgi:hypothetical protein
MTNRSIDVITNQPVLTRNQAAERAAAIKARNLAAVEHVARDKADEPALPASPDPALDEAVAMAETALRQAGQTLDRLHAQQRTAIAHGEALAAERQRISYAAHNGDAKARTRLDGLHVEIATHRSELASIEAALAEAKTLIKDAGNALAAAREQRLARETLARLDTLSEAAAGCDAALRQFLLAFERFERVAATLGATTGHPQPASLAALAPRALHTALLPFKRAFDSRHLAPPERTTFAAIAAAWSHVVTEWANQRLAPATDEAA